MITFDVEQGTAQWLALRMGIPTASRFDEIITPAKMQLSKSCDKYMHELIAERLGYPKEQTSSGYIDRGSELELKAVKYYELHREVETEAVGFVMRDDRRVGCSPDRFVGTDGLLEIKCPSPHVHVSYLLDENGIGYKLQCQGQLWLTGRSYIDTLSYHPNMPPALVRRARDEGCIRQLAAAVDQFCSYVDESQEKLIRLGFFSKEDFELKPVELEVVKPRRHRLDDDMWQHRAPVEGVTPIDPFFKGPSEEAIRAGLERNEQRASEVGL